MRVSVKSRRWGWTHRAARDGPNFQAPTPLEAVGIERLELLEEAGKVDHRAVAQNVLRVRVDETAREQVKSVLLVLHHDCVARVRTAIEARNDVVVLREHVGQLPLSLVAPLASHYRRDARLHSGLGRCAHAAS
jgi:hypothetical protein